MTLKELTSETRIQGNVRLSAWNDDEEIFVKEYENTDGWKCDLTRYNEWEVNYMFCPGDGFLHIELIPD